MCGAATCRGTMDTQPERLKDFGKRIEVWWEGDNVYYRGTVIGFSKKAHKHTILYDDHESEKVSLDITPHRCTLCPCCFWTGSYYGHTHSFWPTLGQCACLRSAGTRVLCRVACPALKASESYCRILVKQPSCIYRFSPTCMQTLDARSIVAVSAIRYTYCSSKIICAPHPMHSC